MARETEDNISYTRVVEITRRIERIRGQGREAAPEKRPRYFSSFSGASSRGRGLFGRGHPIKSIQSELQVSPSPSGGHAVYGSRFEQPVFSTPSASISAPPLQSYYEGHSGHQRLSQTQQLCQLRGCFECGDTCHVRRYCPKLRRSRPQQGTHAMIPKLAALPPTQLAIDMGQGTRGGG
nr:uncharacterized protein LOC104092068 [Nicotiana tomentosiformis]XP_009595849.1 uncharacterized protein LOC104092068 [Nicotiana tomentosiformis]XP_033510947.1 uncharacterized protein LOC104092068 [Nicotiana tomentosiformis]XP_033510948.1 uncharacterized protein LOC104092068 [Nicotiana tomentosiformis]XP_033510949.1 uncharacterized protein LOC104092068 [Nicotiana tomentosiformis]